MKVKTSVTFMQKTPVYIEIYTGFKMVEPRGLEPLTPTMPLWCSTN